VYIFGYELTAASLHKVSHGIQAHEGGQVVFFE